METYLVFRRSSWRSVTARERALASSLAEAEAMDDSLAWLRSYMVAELDGSVGSVCVFRAESPEAVRTHARRAELPVDEIIRVADTLVVRQDRESTTSIGRED